MKKIRDGGHEIGHHGWVHENPADFDDAGERIVLDRGLEALQRAAGIRPAGYRSPAWDVSERTIPLLLEYGFDYDSSFMGNDLLPYYLREGDVGAPNDPYVFGTPVDLVEIPVAWHLDDFPHFEFLPGFASTMKPASAVEEIWFDEFRWGYANVPGGVLDLTMHPQVIGRGHRMLMLERLIRRFTEFEGVAFETMHAVAQRWRIKNPLLGATAPREAALAGAARGG